MAYTESCSGFIDRKPMARQPSDRWAAIRREQIPELARTAHWAVRLVRTALAKSPHGEQGRYRSHHGFACVSPFPCEGAESARWACPEQLFRTSRKPRNVAFVLIRTCCGICAQRILLFRFTRIPPVDSLSEGVRTSQKRQWRFCASSGICFGKATHRRDSPVQYA